MPNIEEGRYAGEFIVSEGNGAISREAITILAGHMLEAGTVLGRLTSSIKFDAVPPGTPATKIAADGTYTILDPTASDGSETAAAILYDTVDASGGDTEGVAIVRLAEVHANELVWPDSITVEEQVAALGDLVARSIIAR